MKALRDQPIRRKLMTIIMFVSGVALLASGIAFVAYEQFMFREKLTRDIGIAAAIVGDNSAAALTFNEAVSATEMMRSFDAEPHIVAACIYDKAGRPFAQYRRVRQGFFVPPPVQREGCRFEGNRLFLFRPIMSADERAGTMFIECDLTEMRDRLHHYGIVGAIILAGSLALIWLLGSRMQRMVWQPISHLATVAGAVAQKQDFSIRAHKESEDELGQLIDRFNAMLGEIQRRDAALIDARSDLERRVEERTRELQVEVAERRRAEEARKESEALYSSLVENLPVAIYRKDVLGRFTFVNKAFCTAAGKPAQEFLGRTDFETTDRALAEKYRRDDERVMLERSSLAFEEKYIAKGGEVLDTQVFKVPVFGADGAVKGTQGCFFDVTDRRKMQEALAYERDLLRSLLDNSPDYIYFKDAQSRFIKCGRTLATRLGFASPDELVGKTDSDVLSEAAARESFEDEQRIMRTGTPLVGKVEHELLMNGAESWVLTTKVPYRDKDGKIIGTFGISKDITDLKRAEQELERLHHRLVDASRRAGMAEVATGVLHNVGNVLTSANVSVTVLAEQLERSRLPSLEKTASLLRSHAADLSRFLTEDPRGRQLPEFLCILSGHLAQEQVNVLAELQLLAGHIEHIKEIVTMQQAYARVSGLKEPLPIASLVEDALRMNSAALVRHDVTVVRDFDAVPPVLVDRHKVLQILINLISNAKYAVDSRSGDKWIRIRIEQERDGVACVRVSDNGVGIPCENLTRVFEHGFTTRSGGHGFGLHSSALAAKELGGSLSAHSQGLGQVATFVLELPIADETAPVGDEEGRNVCTMQA